jgi:site-specific DNA-cytosine methylase
MAEGFRRAGIVFSWAFDADPDACESYERNHGHRPVQMDVRDLVRMARSGWSPGSVDLIVADPPCTPWSRAGKRKGVDDHRDVLRETVELIARLRPAAYLIGNVPGLQDSTQWHHVQEHIGGLQREGYCVADYVQLDAADYGVPQHRVRPFWFGHLSGPCIRWPAPTHGPPGQPTLPGVQALEPWVTCRDALQHLPLGELGRPVRMRIREAGDDGRKNGGDRTRCSTPNEAARTVVAKPDRKGGQILIANTRHPAAILDAPSNTLCAKYRGQSEVPSVPDRDRHPPSEIDEPSRTIRCNSGRVSRGGSMLGVRIEDPNRPPADPDAPHRAVTTVDGQALAEWPWDRPSTTVCADRRIAPPGHHEDAFLSPKTDGRRGPNAIVLSEKAAAILQGFPETWVFVGDTKKARWSQIGQAMPPGLAEPVARAIVVQMEATATRSV